MKYAFSADSDGHLKESTNTLRHDSTFETSSDVVEKDDVWKEILKDPKIAKLFNKTPRDRLSSSSSPPLRIPLTFVPQAPLPSKPAMDLKGSKKLFYDVFTLKSPKPLLVSSTVCIAHPGAQEAVTRLFTCSTSNSWSALATPRHRMSESEERTGMGLFSTQDLEVGDLIATTRPILVYPTVAQSSQKGLRSLLHRAVYTEMGLEARTEFLSLTDCKTNGKNKSTPIGILETNGLNIGVLAGDDLGYQALCPVLARINHSCRPNTQIVWDIDNFCFRARAIRSILKDEELTISYLDSESLCAPRPVRYKVLEKKYDFACLCDICLLDSETSLRVDTVRAMLVDPVTTATCFHLDTDLYDDWLKSTSIAHKDVIEHAERAMRLMENEGYWNSDIWPEVVRRIVKVYCAMGDVGKVRMWAKKAGGLSYTYAPRQMDAWKRIYHEPWKIEGWNTKVEATKSAGESRKE